MTVGLDPNDCQIAFKDKVCLVTQIEKTSRVECRTEEGWDKILEREAKKEELKEEKHRVGKREDERGRALRQRFEEFEEEGEWSLGYGEYERAEELLLNAFRISMNNSRLNLSPDEISHSLLRL